MTSTPKSHAYIVGTGRAGTSFLVHLLTALGVDTGFTLENIPLLLDKKANAGLEWDPRQVENPYLVKSPYFYLYAEEILKNPQIKVDHIFIPVRNLNDAAMSRVSVTQQESDPSFFNNLSAVPGGLVDTFIPTNQEQILSAQLIDLIINLSKYNVGVTLIHFPLLVNDPTYLFQKLTPILSGIEFAEFKKAFLEIAKPELVHEFQQGNWAESKDSIAELLKLNHELTARLKESPVQSDTPKISYSQKFRSLLRKFL